MNSKLGDVDQIEFQFRSLQFAVCSLCSLQSAFYSNPCEQDSRWEQDNRIVACEQDSRREQNSPQLEQSPVNRIRVVAVNRIVARIVVVNRIVACEQDSRREQNSPR